MRSQPTASAVTATGVASSAIRLDIAHKISGLEDEDKEDEGGSAGLVVDEEPMALEEEEEQDLVEGHLSHLATPRPADSSPVALTTAIGRLSDSLRRWRRMCLKMRPATTRRGTPMG